MQKPEGMSPRAQEVWDAVAGKCASSDVDILRAYCETVADLEHAEAQVRTGGTMMIAANGDVKPSPWVALVDSRRRLLFQIAGSLGLIDAKKRIRRI